MSGWAPLVPYAKARAGLDEGGLGLLLLCLGIGSIVAMPLAGALAARFGCRVVILVGGVLVCVALPILASASSPVWLVAGLLLFGGAIGSVDVTMNMQAIVVERDSKRAMMSGFHGLFSAGGMTGAVGITAMLGLGASPLAAIVVVVAAIVLGLVLAAPGLLRDGSEDPGPAFAIPRGIVLVIGVLTFVMFLMEGAVLDWSGVFLTAVRGLPAVYAGLGYAAFSLTMTIGRLFGDVAVLRIGPRRIVLFGGLIAVAGMLLLIVVPGVVAALLGYALLGVGCSNIVPVLFTAVGRQDVMPEAIAVPAISTLGYAGILAGPAAIGFAAHLAGLPVAFLILAALLAAVAASGRLLFRP